VTFFYARDIVTIAFARGAFGSSAVRLTSLGLQCYACGFVFIVLKALFIKAFFAMRDSRTPMVISICEVACNIIIAVSLSYLIGFAGVIISISVSSFFASLVMLLILHRRIPGLRLVNIYQSLLKLLVALFLLGLFLRVSTEYQVHNSVYIRFALVVAASGIIYIGSLTVLRCREFIRLLLSARRVIRRKFC
jgi:putative peptidoglycan lipid II flippase